MSTKKTKKSANYSLAKNISKLYTSAILEGWKHFYEIPNRNKTDELVRKFVSDALKEKGREDLIIETEPNDEDDDEETEEDTE